MTGPTCVVHPLATVVHAATFVTNGSSACEGDVGTTVFVIDVVAETAALDGFAASWTYLGRSGGDGWAAWVLTRWRWWWQRREGRDGC